MCTHAFVCLILEHKCTVNYTVSGDIFGIPISFDRRTRDIVNKKKNDTRALLSGHITRCRCNEVRGTRARIMRWEKGISQKVILPDDRTHAWGIPLFTRKQFLTLWSHRLLLLFLSLRKIRHAELRFLSDEKENICLYVKNTFNLDT